MRARMPEGCRAASRRQASNRREERRKGLVVQSDKYRQMTIVPPSRFLSLAWLVGRSYPPGVLQAPSDGILGRADASTGLPCISQDLGFMAAIARNGFDFPV